VRLVADGYTNAQIGAELRVAPKTASAHIEHILAKLGMGRRAEVARPGPAVGPCYTPALTAMTGKSSDGTAPERVRDGASRAGATA
jgi:hypothetical protein